MVWKWLVNPIAAHKHRKPKKIKTIYQKFVKKALYQIKHQPPDKQAIIIDTATNLEDAIIIASCHSENLPDTELVIQTPKGDIL